MTAITFSKALTQTMVGAGAAGAAGHDEKVPRVFLVMSDLLTVIVAFGATSIVAPWVQWLFLPSGPLHLRMPAWLALPPSPPAEFPPLANLAWVLVIAIPITLLSMELLGGYRQILDQSRTRIVVSSALAPLAALSFVTMAFFALKIFDSSRVIAFVFTGISIAGLLIYRSALRLYKKRRLEAGLYAKNVVLVGPASAVAWTVAHFRQNVPTNRFRPVGWLSVGTDSDDTDTAALEVPCLGGVDDLSQLLISRPFHEVIAIQCSGARDWLKQVIEDCDYYRVRLHIVPAPLILGTLRDLQLTFRADPLRLPEVVLAPPHLETDALFIKRLIDVVVSAALLVLLSPLFLAIAVAIKLTTPRLPVFYPWRVVGYKGRRFTGYKFTTMVADADERKQELMSRNEMTGPVFKIKNDPRLTWLGRFLRKYSLNELPQLWSVLKGDMSLVGPRPAGPHELDRYELWHKRKLCVQPGITCIWQVTGRNQISKFDEWVRLDLEYIDRWSLWLDFQILARTAWAVLAGTGS